MINKEVRRNSRLKLSGYLPGCRTATIHPDAAFFHPELAEFILPYAQVRLAADPEQLILDFYRSTYEIGATLAGWDRAALESGG